MIDGGVTPGVILEYLDQALPSVSKQPDAKGVSWGAVQSGELSVLMSLLNSLPSAFVLGGRPQIYEFLMAREALRIACGRWAAGDQTATVITPPALRPRDPVRVIRAVLVECPSELPVTDDVDFGFLGDNELARVLRSDYAASARAFATGEWKACTVLAGSVVEALLLWALEHIPVDSSRANAWSDFEAKHAKTSMNQWALGTLVDANEASGRVTEVALSAAMLAKEHRNLIHPGRVIRLAAQANPGTAHIALGAVHLVAEALRAR